MTKRRRGNDGHHLLTRQMGIGLRQSLVNKLWTPTPRAERREPKRRTGRRVFTDEEVIRIRRLHEWLGLGPTEIVRRIGHGTAASVTAICDYVNVPHLEPGPEPAEVPDEGCADS